MPASRVVFLLLAVAGMSVACVDAMSADTKRITSIFGWLLRYISYRSQVRCECLVYCNGGQLVSNNYHP
ncbi:hypothetical protein L873DRAFT_1797470 [Choiromyces venosus 120613-1]|uniref:Uncharacterized protein n=1 Tax=Choiromyces venosus 120613-1 TaxID=1336337 RepID=A0A3N4K5S1_9PEZI|nr:hypothetical protein L873DRAFT_1797470 [Choiromyces venosus 120613-1]